MTTGPILFGDFYESYKKWYLSHKDIWLSPNVISSPPVTVEGLANGLSQIGRSHAIGRVTVRRRFADISSPNSTGSDVTVSEPIDGKHYVDDVIARFEKGYRRFDATRKIRPDYLLLGATDKDEEDEDCLIITDAYEDDVDVVGVKEEALTLQDVENVQKALQHPPKNSRKNIAAQKPKSRQNSYSNHDVTPLPTENAALAPAFASRPLTTTTTAAERKSGATAVPLQTAIAANSANMKPVKTEALPTLFSTPKSNAPAAVLNKNLPFTFTLTQSSAGGNFDSPVVAGREPSHMNFMRTSTPIADKSDIPDFTFRPSDFGMSSSTTVSPAANQNRASNRTEYHTAPSSTVFTADASDSSAFVTANGRRSEDPSMLKRAVVAQAQASETARQIDNEIFDPDFLGGCLLAKWIQHFTRLHAEIDARIKTFEADSSQKAFRFLLKRSIVDKINFSTKKKVTNEEVISVLKYFMNLFTGKPVEDSDGAEFCLDPTNTAVIDFAQFTVAQKYFEQVKWDIELMDSIVLVLVSICRNLSTFYDVMCAVVVNASVLLTMSVSRVLDKALSFAREPPEVAALWISSERAIFRLFSRIQFALKLTSQPVNAELPKGNVLMHMLLQDTLFLKHPVFCSSAFIVSEFFEHALKHLVRFLLQCNKKLNPFELIQLLGTMAMRICDYDWATVLHVIEQRLAHTPSVATIIRSRHEALLCVLRRNVQIRLSKVEKSLNSPKPASSTA